MIEFVVSLIMLLFLIYALTSFIFFPVSVFFSLILIITFFILIKKSLKQKEMLRYFMISLLLTAIFLIFSSNSFLKILFDVLEKKLFLSQLIFPFVLIYFFMKISKYSYDYLKPFIKNFKNNLSKRQKKS